MEVFALPDGMFISVKMPFCIDNFKRNLCKEIKYDLLIKSKPILSVQFYYIVIQDITTRATTNSEKVFTAVKFRNCIFKLQRKWYSVFSFSIDVNNRLSS